LEEKAMLECPRRAIHLLEYRYQILNPGLLEESTGLPLEASLVRTANGLTRLGLILALTTRYLIARDMKVASQSKRSRADPHWFRGKNLSRSVEMASGAPPSLATEVAPKGRGGAATSTCVGYAGATSGPPAGPSDTLFKRQRQCGVGVLPQHDFALQRRHRLLTGRQAMKYISFSAASVLAMMASIFACTSAGKGSGV
jgi:hypothetical protein